MFKQNKHDLFNLFILLPFNRDNSSGFFEIIKEHLIAPIKLQDIIDAGKPMIIVLLFWPAYLGWLVWKKILKQTQDV